jgi:hypothetical protein
MSGRTREFENRPERGGNDRELNRNRPNLIVGDSPDDLDTQVTSGGASLVVSDSPDDGTITRPQVAPPSVRAGSARPERTGQGREANKIRP